MQRKLIRLDNIVGAALMSLLPDILRWEFGLLCDMLRRLTCLSAAPYPITMEETAATGEQVA